MLLQIDRTLKITFKTAEKIRGAIKKDGFRQFDIGALVHKKRINRIFLEVPTT